MDINTEKIRALASLDDSQFSAALSVIASALGFPPEKAKQAGMNTAFFRALLANASDRDIRSMINKVGKDKIEDIYGKLPPEGR